VEALKGGIKQIIEDIKDEMLPQYSDVIKRLEALLTKQGA